MEEKSSDADEQLGNDPSENKTEKKTEHTS